MKIKNKKIEKFLNYLIYRIEFVIGMIFIKIFMLFPEKQRFNFAGKLGRLYFKLDKRRRNISFANMGFAFPDMGEEEKKLILLEAYSNMFKSFISTIWFDTYLKDEKNIKLVNFDAIVEGMKEHGSVMCATMHMGNMESSLKTAEYYPVATIAKKQKNPLIDKYITRNRTKLGIKLLKKSRSTASDLKKLMGQGYVFGIFSDHRDKGTDVTFFGKETTAPTGAVSISMRNNLPLFLSYSILNKDNTSTTYISEEIKLVDTGNFKKDVNVNVQNLIHQMEKVILEHPEQWMWFHDRWSLSDRFKKKKH